MKDEYREILESAAGIFELVKRREAKDVQMLIITLVPTHDEKEPNMAMGTVGKPEHIAALIDEFLTDYPAVLEELMLRKIGDMMVSDFSSKLSNLVALSGTVNKIPA